MQLLIKGQIITTCAFTYIVSQSLIIIENCLITIVRI